MKSIKALVAIIFFMVFTNVNAQINLGGKAKDQTNNKANSSVDQGIDQGLDAVGNGVKGLFKKKKSTETQPEEKVEQTLATEQKPETQDVKPASGTPSLQSYSKFDFIPGAKVIFYDDFAETSAGDFPPSWNTNASGEVVTTNLYPGNWFKMIGSGCIALEEGLKLPDNYTIEYDVITFPKDEGNTAFEFGFYLYSAENPKDLNEGGAVPGLKGGIKMSFGYRGTYSAYDETGYTLDGVKDDAVMEAGDRKSVV